MKQLVTQKINQPISSEQTEKTDANAKKMQSFRNKIKNGKNFFGRNEGEKEEKSRCFGRINNKIKCVF